MQSIKRELSLGTALSALVFAGALCWGSPFVASHAAVQATQEQGMPQMTQQPQNAQQAAKTESFTGTVVREGNTYVLQSSDGQTYKLANAAQAKSYDGKNVTVTGKLDSQSKTIQVQNISGS